MKKMQLLFTVLFSFLLSQVFVSLIPEFSDDFSFVVYDEVGNLLNAKVATDEQWRFPQTEKLDEKYKACAILYEDKNFYFHFGVDPMAVFRAILLNLKHRKIVSGASTLTMQLARLSENNPERTFLQKIREMFLSLVLEIVYSKNQIFNLYANNAPYGGNVVGVSAASWRYFSRPQSSLSIAEVATLAVLPNEPSLVRPGLNAKNLTKKRNAILKKLLLREKISDETYSLSVLEQVPEAPSPLPSIVPHYAEYLNRIVDSNFASVKIDLRLQERATEILEVASLDASRSGVYNACAIILENSTGNILAYVGNTGIHKKNRKIENQAVDLIQSKRSSGSLLKPFLYAAAIDASVILPTQLLPDLPTQFGSYIPQNNNHYFLGAVRADEALTKSLNIPFVNLLSDYSVDNFLILLQKLNLTTFTKSAEYYGLPLILGGGEITLFEIVRAYKNFANCAFNKNKNDFPISSAACRITLDVLKEGVRPEEEEAWRFFSSSKKIAWKTGTSYGSRDAWSIGVTADYTVGVWFGNANGIGRPEITSATLANPVMFKLFELLPNSVWLPRNEIDYKIVKICKHSGFIASQYCDEQCEIQIPRATLIDRVCPYCKPILLTSDKKFRVTNIEGIKTFPTTKNFFILPPAQEYYYSQAHSDYEKLPPRLNATTDNFVDFQIIFPKNYSNIYIPAKLDGSPGAFIAKTAYLEKDKELFWYLDKSFLRVTKNIHEVQIYVNYGKHYLKVMDSSGNAQTVVFFVLSK